MMTMPAWSFRFKYLAIYTAGFLPNFERFGGQLLVSSKFETEVIEVEWACSRMVIMKFPSIDRPMAGTTIQTIRHSPNIAGVQPAQT